MTVEFLPLCTFTAYLERPFQLGRTPSGSRFVFETSGGCVDGERLSGALKGKSAADWLTVGPDGTGTVDVRALIETRDGALVSIQYQGRTDFSNGGGAPIYIAPRFETSDERYAWLNRVQAVGKGIFDGRTLTYEVFEVR